MWTILGGKLEQESNAYIMAYCPTRSLRSIFIMGINLWGSVHHHLLNCVFLPCISPSLVSSLDIEFSLLSIFASFNGPRPRFPFPLHVHVHLRNPRPPPPFSFFRFNHFRGCSLSHYFCRVFPPPFDAFASSPLSLNSYLKPHHSLLPIICFFILTSPILVLPFSASLQS